MQTKDIQGKLWSTAPADWVKYIEPTFIPLYQAVLARLDLNEEKMLLDAGCGSGLFLSMVSTSGAHLHGIDAAPGLLAVTKERVPEAVLMIEDLEALPYIDGTFDVVTGFNSFQYAGSFENALAEARRVVKWHGKVIIGIWGKEKDCESAGVLRAVANLLPPPLSSIPGTFSLSEDGKVEVMCNALGLKVLGKQNVFCPWWFIGPDALEKAFLSIAPCVKAVEVAGEEAVRKAIVDSAQPYCLADDVYYMKNYFTFFVAEKI